MGALAAGQVHEEFQQGILAVLEVFKDKEQRHHLADRVEDLNHIHEEMIVFVLHLVADDGFRPSAGAALEVGLEHIDMQRIDIAALQKFDVVDLGEIPLVERADPVHQRGVGRLHQTGLELVIKRLHGFFAVVGSQQYILEFNGKGIAVFNEKELSVLFTRVLDDGCNQTGNVFFGCSFHDRSFLYAYDRTIHI